jgi:hypothetical protein
MCRLDAVDGKSHSSVAIDGQLKDTVQVNVNIVNAYNTSRTCLSNPGHKSKSYRSVIAVVLPEFYQVLDGIVCSKPCRILDKHFVMSFIRRIDQYFMDNGRAGIIIFHEGYPAVTAINDIRQATLRDVDFVNIDHIFLTPPQGVHPYYDAPAVVDPEHRRKWRREQLIRFQAVDMFKFPVLDNVRYIMHLHFGGCFGKEFTNVFNSMKNQGIGTF